MRSYFARNLLLVKENLLLLKKFFLIIKNFCWDIPFFWLTKDWVERNVMPWFRFIDYYLLALEVFEWFVGPNFITNFVSFIANFVRANSWRVPDGVAFVSSRYSPYTWQFWSIMLRALLLHLWTLWTVFQNFLVKWILLFVNEFHYDRSRYPYLFGRYYSVKWLTYESLLSMNLHTYWSTSLEAYLWEIKGLSTMQARVAKAIADDEAEEREEDEKETIRLRAVIEPYAIENIRWGVPRNPLEKYEKILAAARQPLSEEEHKLVVAEYSARAAVQRKGFRRDFVVESTMTAGKEAAARRREYRNLELERLKRDEKLKKEWKACRASLRLHRSIIIRDCIEEFIDTYYLKSPVLRLVLSVIYIYAIYIFFYYIMYYTILLMLVILALVLGYYIGIPLFILVDSLIPGNLAILSLIISGDPKETLIGLCLAYGMVTLFCEWLDAVREEWREITTR